MAPSAEPDAAPAEAPGARAEAAFQEDVRANLPRNFGAHLAHGLLGMTGFRLIQAPTFIPQYVFLLSGSELVVGLARALQGLGHAVTPLFAATLIEHRRRVLPLGFWVGGLMRAQVLGIALAGFFLPSPWNLIATCFFLGCFGLFLGMQGVLFNFLMSKVIPVELRGRLNGVRNFLAGLTAASVAWVGGYLIERDALGNGYASTFLLAFVLTALGLGMLVLLREPRSPAVRERGGFVDRLRELPALMRADRAFTHYFVARSLATLGHMAMPYYVLFAGTQLALGGAELTGRSLGVLTRDFLLAQMLFNLVWGLLADRRGFRAVLVLALLVWVLSVLILMHTQTQGSLQLVFIGLGAGTGGFMMGAQNLALEFGRREDLPMRIAVANTTSQLMLAIGPLIGGLLVTLASYEVLFYVAIAFQLASLALLVLLVEEPRRRSRRERVA
ncbi:MAG: MFS transporter [Deltaproteobacteria bacterium]|nr:MAG: MFS transporter [Deltaproteobacteria bacterium]